ncbi:unnamed protein product [Closterium sp. NIES-64]|nr:unnamed protein product [Closterium sp. NIES-64]
MATPSVLAFDAEGRAIDFEVWVDDLQLFLQCDRADGLSLFDLTSGASPAPTADADPTVRSQWATRDAAARLAVRRHLPTTERAHFSQYKSAQTLYDAVVARYSSPATAALSRLMLPYLFPDLTAFPTVADLITHLCTSDTRYRAALPADRPPRRPVPVQPSFPAAAAAPPDHRAAVQPSRPAPEPPCTRAARQPSRPAPEPPCTRAARHPSRPAAEPPGSRAAQQPSRRVAEPPDLPCPGRAIDFEVWVDDLQLFLQCDRADGLSLFDLTSGASPAPAADADPTVRSQWATRDAAARLAVRRHLPTTERAPFSQYKSAQTLYDAVVARYSSPATAALSLTLATAPPFLLSSALRTPPQCTSLSTT